MNIYHKIKRKQFLRNAVMSLIVNLISLVYLTNFKTSRTKLHGTEHLIAAKNSDNPVLVCFWHGRLLYCVHGLKRAECRFLGIASNKFVGKNDF